MHKGSAVRNLLRGASRKEPIGIAGSGQDGWLRRHQQMLRRPERPERRGTEAHRVWNLSLYKNRARQLAKSDARGTDLIVLKGILST